MLVKLIFLQKPQKRIQCVDGGKRLRFNPLGRLRYEPSDPFPEKKKMNSPLVLRHSIAEDT